MGLSEGCFAVFLRTVHGASASRRSPCGQLARAKLDRRVLPSTGQRWPPALWTLDQLFAPGRNTLAICTGFSQKRLGIITRQESDAETRGTRSVFLLVSYRR